MKEKLHELVEQKAKAEKVMQELWQQLCASVGDPKYLYMSPEWSVKLNLPDGSSFKGATVHVVEGLGECIYMTQNLLEFGSKDDTH